MPSIGQRIQFALDRADVRQKDLADKLGVNPATVSGYISGKIEPSVKVIQMVSKMTGVTLEWLITGEGPMHRTEAATGTCATGHTYLSGQALTDEHVDKVVKEDLVKYCAQFGVNKVVADLMLRETLSEIIQAGKLTEGDQFGCLGNFMNDAQRRLAKWTGCKQPVQDEDDL